MAVRHMSEIFHQHTPVLLTEAVANLAISPDGIYVDATFGRGSHSEAILRQLSKKGRLFAFDKDLAAVTYAQKHFSQDPRFHIFHSSYAALSAKLATQRVVGQVNGILFDLGLSSPQVDDPARGFSFTREGELDMRMDQSSGVSAAIWLSKVDEETLANVLFEYGEEKFSRRIARAIVDARAEKPITTTLALAEIISKAIPNIKSKYDKHPATRSFQAIRIVINKELEELNQALAQSLDVLALHGRLAVISFHSLEDRIVKHFIRHHEKGLEIPRGLPIKGAQINSRLKSIGKPIKASDTEIKLNPRSRSAILRTAEKLS